VKFSGQCPGHRARAVAVANPGLLPHAQPMKFGALTGLVLGVAAWQASCSRPAAPPPQVSVATNTVTGRSQPRLATIKLWLGPKEIVAEQAIRPDQVQTGMMFRKEMGEDEGMLFVFGQPQRVSFWMRNTLLPLSCAYIDPSGTILEIHDMKPLDETPIESSSNDVQYVLEMKQGWFERNHITVGASLRTERGTLSETYFGHP
jgi:uncharacterized membrane protein (UPF0127 family)